jgi:hypothetical protein
MICRLTFVSIVADGDGAFISTVSLSLGHFCIAFENVAADTKSANYRSRVCLTVVYARVNHPSNTDVGRA